MSASKRLTDVSNGLHVFGRNWLTSIEARKQRRYRSRELASRSTNSRPRDSHCSHNDTDEETAYAVVDLSTINTGRWNGWNARLVEGHRIEGHDGVTGAVERT